jgi:hypothetical protein
VVVVEEVGAGVAVALLAGMPEQVSVMQGRVVVVHDRGWACQSSRFCVINATSAFCHYIPFLLLCAFNVLLIN